MIAHAKAIPDNAATAPRAHAVQAWWHGLELGRKLDIIIAGVLLPIVAATAFLGSVSGSLQEKTGTAAKYRNTAFAVYDLKVAMLNVETGYRGYALTGNRNFLEPYNQGLSDATPAIEKLRAAAAFPAEANDLIAQVENYERWAAQSLERVQVGVALPTALQQNLLDEGKARFDVLRSRFDSLTTLALTNFNRAREETISGINIMSYLPWGTFALIVMVAWLTRFSLQRLIVQPIQRLEVSAQRLADGDGSIRLPVLSGDEMGKLTTTFNQTAETLSKRDADLRRSNRDLEQFAYVASHDLQEPLRMVSSYTQLLGKRYEGKLDEKADLYIHYAVDGANRMQALIQDLLKYSRAGTSQVPMVAVDTGRIVNDVMNVLQIAVEESRTKLEVGPLPTVLGDAGQLAQVFQNLIGNALKFRREGVEHTVTVSAEHEPPSMASGRAMWRFTIRDNGIGIAPQYFERIFVIFQRLHTRENFSGSGIGLAICQRIIERHGGRIWVESTQVGDDPAHDSAGVGSSFHFTLPASKDAEQPQPPAITNPVLIRKGL
jgi:signal transduction histidine kinase